MTIVHRIVSIPPQQWKNIRNITKHPDAIAQGEIEKSKEEIFAWGGLAKIIYLSLRECSLANSLLFCLSHSRRALSCSSRCLFLRSCSRSFSFTLACFPSNKDTKKRPHRGLPSLAKGTWKLTRAKKQKKQWLVGLALAQALPATVLASNLCGLSWKPRDL